MSTLLYVLVTWKITPWPCIYPRKVTAFDSCPTTTTKVKNTRSFTPALPIRLHGTLLSNNKLFHAMSEHIGKDTIARSNPPKMYKDVEVQFHWFLSSELHEGDRSASRPIRCISGTHLTADPTAGRKTTPNSALTGSQSSSWVPVLTDISRLPEKWLWLISVFFHSNVSNRNISHRFKCPLGRTTVHRPLAGRISPPDALAPRTVIFSLTFLRLKEHPVQFRLSNVTNLRPMYKQFPPNAKSVSAIFSINL
jgi:hypothetical protein